MILDGPCEWRPLAFSSDLLRASVTLGSGQISLEGRAIVVNAGGKAAGVFGWRPERVAPMSSTQLRDVRIDAPPNLLLLAPSTGMRATDISGAPNWTQFRSGGHPVNLWSSSRDTIGDVLLDVGPLCEAGNGNAGAKPWWKRFRVTVNLWFAPAGTNCLIHRDHSFIEIHSQIVGMGHMQKFRWQSDTSLYEDIALAPGATTELPFCVLNDEGIPAYPWHQYFAESDCIWLAIEYHPLTEKNENAR
ncbi:hypothetical protein [Paraburkholderia sp. BCC1885]|uniref:hypothetical protein n=1 Tax=Paraburkholderia sp. BCC1885 TaxID=2562669 RepID=UPI001182AFBC|nr:hypothetical protein [Paraburkholderia sp. BCC1885]